MEIENNEITMLQQTKAEKGITMDNESKEVTVVDINMPFLSMVVFMVKWSIAAIPAALILIVVWLIIAGSLGGLLGGLLAI